MAKYQKKITDKLPSWFPLEIYDKELTLTEWANEMACRCSLFDIMKNGDMSEALLHFNEHILRDRADDRPFQFEHICPPIGDLTKFDLSMARAIDDLPEHEILPGKPIYVDLDYDDKALEDAFKKWLKFARKKTGTHCNPIKTTRLKQWKENHILAIFDLDSWSKIIDFKYTDDFVADTLWSEDCSVEEPTKKLRDTARDKAYLQISWSTVRHLHHEIKNYEKN